MRGESASAGARRTGRKGTSGGRRRSTARRVLRAGGERASPLELGGALACFLGAGLAAGAAFGWAPSSGALVYLALLAAAAGGHVVAADASTDLRAERMARIRLVWALAEPAFLLALGVALFRWGAGDLEAVHGAQRVLGAGIAVGPPLAAAGLIAAASVLLVAGALRLVPAEEAVRGRGRRAGGALLIGLCRWATAGATAVVAATLVMGREPDLDDAAAMLGPAGAAAVAAVVIGAADGLLSRLPRARPWVGPLGAVAAVAAAFLVVLS